MRASIGGASPAASFKRTSVLVWKGLGECLKALAQSATAEIVIVAPFIKRATLRQLLADVPPDVALLCVTRWRVDELACGVSDLDVYIDMAERRNARMLLLKDLHAKYFRFDGDVVAGSCNVTGAALGFKDPANVELAVILQKNERTSVFEADLIADGVTATHEMYEAIKRVLKIMPITQAMSIAGEGGRSDPPPLACNATGATIGWAHWMPACRSPDSLYDAYAGHLDGLTRATRDAAYQDLAQLAVPSGLTRVQFEAFVGGTILSSPVVARLAEFCSIPRRFGEVRNLLRVIAPTASATNDWQTIMRWLLHFAPNRFAVHVANYSEIFTAKW
ncbi:phospholipase D family protein [Paraburkholderia atlantica]|uniref:phospholipase D family protein n=1 Tax=Paraburkholderia atlantica TaxID=2654982 RepID=UPI001C853D9B|nr:phospholipase D family protein [Paraburkholderia atlantica]